MSFVIRTGFEDLRIGLMEVVNVGLASGVGDDPHRRGGILGGKTGEEGLASE